MDFLKTLKNYHITYLSEFPSEDIKVYMWYENKWIFTQIIDKSDFDLKDLKDAYDDLSNAVKKLTKIAANTENDELSSKLSKITTKILQAKYELADDVIEPFENSLKDKE